MGRVDGLRPVKSSPLFFSVSIPFSFSDFLVLRFLICFAIFFCRF
jgi:hypothetical protein